MQVEDSVNTILSHIDNMMQYGEDEEPKMPKDMDEGESSECFVAMRADRQATLTLMSDRCSGLRPLEYCCTTICIRDGQAIPIKTRAITKHQS